MNDAQTIQSRASPYNVNSTRSRQSMPILSAPFFNKTMGGSLASVRAFSTATMESNPDTQLAEDTTPSDGAVLNDKKAKRQAVKHLLHDMNANRPRAKMIKGIAAKILYLEQQLALLKSTHVAEVMAEAWSHSPKRLVGMERRAKQRARRRATKLSLTNEDITQLDALLQQYKQHLEEYKIAEADSIQIEEALRTHKKELLVRKQELLDQLRGLDRGVMPTTLSHRVMEMREDSDDLGDILDVAVSKSARTSLKSQMRKNRSFDDPPQVTITEDDTSALPRRTSDDLRLQVPASGLIPIDSALTVSLDADVTSLQHQVFEMKERLKVSYPRIDNLPYDVWTSSNRKTLQTWLKILVSRWQTRFDNVGIEGDDKPVDPAVQSLLDQLVRDHNLSNAAARRMAKKWRDVVRRRVAVRKGEEVEELKEWDGDEAGELGFLRYDEVNEMEGDAGEEVRSGQVAADTPRPQFAGVKKPSHILNTHRAYSTSSRPPPSSTPPPNPTPSTTTPSSPSSPSLPHLTPTGAAHMVSITHKRDTSRTAIAVGTVYFSNTHPLRLIRSNSLKKGDVLSVSRIAGIMAAKKCPDLVPLCHPILLTSVGVELDVFGPVGDDVDGTEEQRTRQVDNPTPETNSTASSPTSESLFGGISITATVSCTGATGVEMEALTSVMGAALSVVDMCKAVDKGMRIGDVRVVLKEGGRSGTWREDGWEGRDGEK